MVENNESLSLKKKLCLKYGVDEKKIGRLVNKIIILEKRNLNTNAYSSSEMIEKITEMIKEEEKKCF